MHHKEYKTCKTFCNGCKACLKKFSSSKNIHQYISRCINMLWAILKAVNTPEFFEKNIKLFKKLAENGFHRWSNMNSSLSLSP